MRDHKSTETNILIQQFLISDQLFPKKSNGKFIVKMAY